MHKVVPSAAPRGSVRAAVARARRASGSGGSRLDEVAYLRFASVYRSFAPVEDFEKEIAELRRVTGRGGD